MTVKPRLTEADKQAAAKRLGIKLSALKAVCDVESRGSGFLSVVMRYFIKIAVKPRLFRARM